MTYQVLARRCRPRTFSELHGQDAVCRAITHSLEQKRLHHAYLFTGTRGIGKTSIARLLAKALNCEQGISATPCLTCHHCTAIEHGKFIDLIEIDAASRTRVEDTKELLENIHYVPTLGRFKIYLIDEIHMLSTHSFNALLKTLEEPPAHVKFILATTDADKIPITILSRCLQFHLKPLSPQLIQSQMAEILAQENIAFENDALTLIAQAAQGSMRDALSILDQAIAYAKSKIILTADTKTILGHTQEDYALQLLQGLITQNTANLFDITQHIANEGGVYTHVLDKLLEYCHQLAIFKALPQAHPHISLSEDLLKIAKHCSVENIQLFYQIGLKGKSDMSLAPSTAMGFEMTLLRMHAFQLKPAITMSSHHISEPKPADIPQQNPIITSAIPNITPTINKSITPSPTQNNLHQQMSQAASHDKNIPSWSELITLLKLTGLTKNAAEQAEWVSKNNHIINLRLDKSHLTLFNPTTQTRIEQALSDYFKTKIQLNLLTDQPIDNSPAQQKVQISHQRKKEAEQALKDDQVFNTIQETFNATWELAPADINK